MAFDDKPKDGGGSGGFNPVPLRRSAAIDLDALSALILRARMGGCTSMRIILGTYTGPGEGFMLAVAGVGYTKEEQQVCDFFAPSEEYTKWD